MCQLKKNRCTATIWEKEWKWHYKDWLVTSSDEVMFGRLAPVRGGPGFVVRRLEEVACMTTSKGHCRLDPGQQAKSHSFFFCKGLDNCLIVELYWEETLSIK
jgi:hypothetical protein